MGHYIVSTCNHPLKPTQLPTLSGTGNEYWPWSSGSWEGNHYICVYAPQTVVYPVYLQTQWPNEGRWAPVYIIVRTIAPFTFLGRFFDWVDLIKPVSYVRPYVRPSIKSFFDFNEIWHAGRVRWVMHDDMQYYPIQGQGHEPFKVGNPAIFRSYLLCHLQLELATNHGFLN